MVTDDFPVFARRLAPSTYSVNKKTTFAWTYVCISSVPCQQPLPQEGLRLDEKHLVWQQSLTSEAVYSSMFCFLKSAKALLGQERADAEARQKEVAAVRARLVAQKVGCLVRWLVGFRNVWRGV